jgi:L-iditol 2-dehydrogenase
MSKTMKAAVLHAPGDLRCEEVQIPEIGDNDVLVKVHACGICGSDLPRVLTAGTYHFPTIPGHEFGGVVVQAGRNAEKSLIGRMVGVIPLIPCRACKMCEVGEFALCEHYDFLGSRSDGGFAEYVKVPAANVIPVPDEVEKDSVAMLEPISVALHVVQNCGVQYGDSVAVYGLGAIGMFIAQWAKIYGAEHVFAIDVDPGKVEIAKKIGLDDALPAGPETENIIREKTNSHGCDIAFEASGAAPAFSQAVQVLRTAGKMGLVGRPVRDLPIQPVTFEKILRSQLTIKGTWSFQFQRFPHNAWKQSLKALQSGKMLTAPLITHRVPIEKTFEAIQMMAGKKEFVHKILVKP